MGKRIFISYKRNTELDQPLAERLFGALREAGHDPFIDQSIAVGEDWARRIQKEVARADFLLLLLSESSVQSGMVVEEVRMANAQFEHSRNQPRILLVLQPDAVAELIEQPRVCVDAEVRCAATLGEPKKWRKT